ncbi:mycoredoxin [Natronoglycomyces albus]|uniref:Mycoredoxin n=1 Tax=Natronoglycomyces albus TaxID=2811108 RepID=A0A895XUC7_9ACTN|nr:mycoredoxin [Natronoglycomyces albus]
MITMYSTTWCGYCRQLKTLLAKEGIDFEEVNIEHDEDAAKWVLEANEGNQTVPTLRFSDDSSLTNPTVAQVKERLASLA